MSEQKMFYAVLTARVIFMAKTSLDDNMFGLV